jgi:hypothetical protein
MKNEFVFVVVLLSAAVAHAGQEPKVTFEMRSRVPLESKAVKDAPYSADVVTDHTQTLADGNRIVEHSTARVFRDKDGRVRREEDHGSGGLSVSIVDPVAGVSYSLDPDQRIAWKTPTPDIMMRLNEKVLAEVQARKVPDGQPRLPEVSLLPNTITVDVSAGRVEMRRSSGGAEQRSDEQLPGRNIEGVSAVGHRTTTTIPAGAIGNDLPIVVTSEEWTSPDLQALVLTERKDPRNGDSTYRLLNISRSEPDASLFQVPPDYTIKETGIRRLDMR